ncbi:Uncharacterized protein GBIM_13911 [Gryllus bimaculatus]|nr:Uncharacterized protein GBIM_13911 [Gryllus bimaculatus]
MSSVSSDVYVVVETVTGYAPEAGEGPGALAPLLPPLPPLAPLHVAPDAALLAGAWLDDDDALHVRHRLQKLDFYFQLLRILSEDCRQRVLCEVAREPERFSPLAAVLGEVTSFSGSYQYVTSHLINTTEGARLLSYMEASFRGQDRARSCAVFQYRCPSRTEDMINYDALCLWREMVRWLTIHVVISLGVAAATLGYRFDVQNDGYGFRSLMEGTALLATVTFIASLGLVYGVIELTKIITYFLKISIERTEYLYLHF